MDQLYSVLMAITNGINNPYLAIAAAIAVLALGLFGKIFMNKMRADKAAREKEADKERDLGRLEDANAESEGNVLDRLNQRKPNGNGTETHQE